MELEVPRDRLGSFEPQLVERYCRRLPGFDDKVISMYARGMTTREIIRGHVRDLYGVEVSAELVSKVTDAVHEEIRGVAVATAGGGVRGGVLRRGAGEGPRRGPGAEQGGVPGDRRDVRRRKEVLGLWIEQTGARRSGSW